MSNSVFRIHRYLREALGNGAHKQPPLKYYKEYERMQRVPLPSLDIQTALGTALDRRKSKRDFGSKLFTISEIGMLLGTLRIRKTGSRPYPSGGALYPMETYVVARNVDGVPPALCHYHPDAHALEVLWDIPDEDIFSIKELAWANAAPATIVITAQWRRTTQKYGDFGYLLGLLEAGHMGQNVLLAAAAQDIAACPVARMNDAAVSRIFDLDQSLEQPVYAIIMGKIK